LSIEVVSLWSCVCIFQDTEYIAGWKVFFMTSWGRFERRFDSIVDDLKAHERLVDSTANATGLSDLRKTREAVEASQRALLDKIEHEEHERAATQYLAIVGWLKLDDSEQGKILDSLLTEPRRYPGTCDWILAHSKISAWMRCSQESTFLALHGNPGTGKSVLAAQIIEFLRLTESSLVVAHVCTYSQAASTEYGQFLRSVLLQLVRSDEDLVAFIFHEFILGKKPITTQALERLILDTVSAISNSPAETKYVHVIVDGIDECSKETQLKVIGLLERMVSAAFTSTSAVCKVLVSSCMPSSLAKKLRQKHVVSLSSEKRALEKSIALYASQKLGALRSRWFQMGISTSELKDLETHLAVKADGLLPLLLAFQDLY
jgi:hypothetical protein